MYDSQYPLYTGAYTEGIFFLDRRQRLCEVRNQIFFILQSAGYTYQSGRYAGGRKLLVVHLTVGGGGRV